MSENLDKTTDAVKSVLRKGPGTFNLPELARECRVHPQTARKWVARGLLPAPIIKVGRTVRWSSAQLEKFLAEGVQA